MGGFETDGEGTKDIRSYGNKGILAYLNDFGVYFKKMTGVSVYNKNNHIDSRMSGAPQSSERYTY